MCLLYLHSRDTDTTVFVDVDINFILILNSEVEDFMERNALQEVCEC